MTSQVLLFIGALNLIYATTDIYDDTVVRCDERSDAYRVPPPHLTTIGTTFNPFPCRVRCYAFLRSTDARSQIAQMWACCTPRCVGFTWLLISIGATVGAVIVVLEVMISAAYLLAILSRQMSGTDISPSDISASYLGNISRRHFAIDLGDISQVTQYLDAPTSRIAYIPGPVVLALAIGWRFLSSFCGGRSPGRENASLLGR